METLYLLKRAADNQWIFGQNADCEHPHGVCRVVPSTDRTTVDIIYIHKNESNQNKYNIPFGNFYKESGDAYASFAELRTAYNGFFSDPSSGIAKGEFDAVLSDTEDLAHPGWIQPRLAGGTIKYVTEYGETVTRVFDQKEISLVKVKQVFSTGTTANLGITVFYE